MKSRYFDPERDAIREIRSRFNAALAAGLSQEDAEKVSRGEMELPEAPLPPAEPIEPEQVEPSDEADDDASNEFLADGEDEGEETAPAAAAVVAAPIAPGVEIPADWRSMKWNDLRRLAAQVSPSPVSNRDECEIAIEAELARRAQQQS